MRNPLRSPTAFAACAAAAALLLATAVAPAFAGTAIHFQRERYPALLLQLRKGQVHAVVLHPQGYKAHVSLDDGAHMTVTYPPREVARLQALAHAHGASFTVATSAPKATAHHKLRYVAAAILIVVILVVLVVLLVGRRRALSEEERSGGSRGPGGTGGGSAAGGSKTGSAASAPIDGAPTDGTAAAGAPIDGAPTDSTAAAGAPVGFSDPSSAPGEN
jgi:hypothetical protein